MSITSRTSNTVGLALDSAASGAVKHPRARLRTVSRNDLKLDWAAGAETADPALPASEWRTAYPDVGGDAGPFGRWFLLRLTKPAGIGTVSIHEIQEEESLDVARSGAPPAAPAADGEGLDAAHCFNRHGPQRRLPAAVHLPGHAEGPCRGRPRDSGRALGLSARATQARPELPALDERHTAFAARRRLRRANRLQRGAGGGSQSGAGRGGSLERRATRDRRCVDVRRCVHPPPAPGRSWRPVDGRSGRGLDGTAALKR